MKILRLRKDEKTWQLHYDEESQSISVEGSGPQGEQLHQWLTKRKHVVISDRGDLAAVFPTESWDYILQVIEKDLYDDFGMVAVGDPESDAG